MHSAGDLVLCFAYFNGLLSRHIDGFHVGYSIGQWKLVGRMLVKVCLEKELCVKHIV